MLPTFTLQSLAESLIPFDPTRSVEFTQDIEDYLDHYKINFSKYNAQVSHHFGYIEAAEFNIATHYFSLENARGTIMIMHGYFDHAGLFGHVIRFCLDNHFSVFIYDLPGHGLSSGDRASIMHFSQYTQVFDHMFNVLQSFDQKPLSIIAQSTGAAITMDYLLNFKQTDNVFQHIIFLAPLVRPHRWKAALRLYHLLHLFVKQVKRKFYANSHNEEFLDFIQRRDPLQPKHVPVAWVGALKHWIQRIETLPESSAKLIIIQGEEDLTIDWRYNLEFIPTKFKQPTIYYIPQGRHHLANESQSLRREIFAIMDKHINHV